MRPAVPVAMRVVITYYNTRISPGGSDTTAQVSSEGRIRRRRLGRTVRLTQGEEAGPGPARAASTTGGGTWSLGVRACAVYRGLDVAVGYAASYPRPDRTHPGGGLPGGEGDRHMTVDTERIDAERERIRSAHLRERGSRPATATPPRPPPPASSPPPRAGPPPRHHSPRRPPRRPALIGRRADHPLLPGSARLPLDRALREP